jgi:hypothetical protein
MALEIVRLLGAIAGGFSEQGLGLLQLPASVPCRRDPALLGFCGLECRNCYKTSQKWHSL